MKLLPRLGLRRWLAHKVRTPIESDDHRDYPAMARARRLSEEQVAARWRVRRAVAFLLDRAHVTDAGATWSVPRLDAPLGYTADDARRTRRIVARVLRLDRDSFSFNVDTQTHHAHPLTPGVAGFYKPSPPTPR